MNEHTTRHGRCRITCLLLEPSRLLDPVLLCLWLLASFLASFLAFLASLRSALRFRFSSSSFLNSATFRGLSKIRSLAFFSCCLIANNGSSRILERSSRYDFAISGTGSLTKVEPTPLDVTNFFSSWSSGSCYEPSYQTTKTHTLKPYFLPFLLVYPSDNHPHHFEYRLVRTSKQVFLCQDPGLEVFASRPFHVLPSSAF